MQALAQADFSVDKKIKKCKKPVRIVNLMHQKIRETFNKAALHPLSMQCTIKFLHQHFQDSIPTG